MRYMTAGGNDKKRSTYTSRVVAITEVDGMDEAGATSREADKVEQIEASDAGIRTDREAGVSGMHNIHRSGENLAGGPERQ
ncbi:MAG: hypothetical protein R3C59_17685 [Planctomycetaceae bacterium]